MKLAPVKTTRLLPSWIESFVDYTSGLPSAPILRRWGAVAAIAGALGRNVWSESLGSPLYPNLYVILVTPPAVGKGVVLKEVRSLWKDCTDIHIGSDSLTKAALVDELMEVREIDRETGMAHCSLAVCSAEFSVLVPDYDMKFLALLTHLWDTPNETDERTRARAKLIMENPCLNIIAGTQPDTLAATFPDVAWGQGFASRLVLIYSGKQVKVPVFRKLDRKLDLRQDLLSDLLRIRKLRGLVRWEPEAMDAMESWHEKDMAPFPTHHKLQNYNGRRLTQFLKLCVVVSVSNRSDLIVTLEDFQEAQRLLLDAEAVMPEIFKTMKKDSHVDLLHEGFNFVWTKYNNPKNKEKPVPEFLLSRFLSERAPSNQIAYLINTMVQTGALREVGKYPEGERVFIPMQLNPMDME